MSTKKYNNDPDWKTALDKLVALPGEEIYNAQAAWNKLEGRLQNKKRVHKMLWYEIAAACIILCAIFFLIKPTTKKASYIEEALIKNPGNNLKADRSFVASNTKHAVPGEPSAAKARVTSHINKKYYSLGREMENRQPAVEIITPREDSFTNILDELPVMKSSPVVFSILKKKLPVIHINDLEKPVAPVESIAGNDDRPFKIRIFGKQQLSVSHPGSNIVADFLKIKLPQN